MQVSFIFFSIFYSVIGFYCEFSIFEELCKWSFESIELLIVALPADIQHIPLVTQERQWSPAIRKKMAKKQLVGFGSFIVLFATIAIQVHNYISAICTSTQY